MNSATFDTRQLSDLARDLGASITVSRDLVGIVRKGAQKIKTEAASLISGHPHAPAYPRSITYDVTTSGGLTSAEIGPDKRRSQGALGNILEYGTSKNAPIPHLQPALEHEAPNTEAAIVAAVVRRLGHYG